MRWYIIRTLLHKEMLRHQANRGGLAMMLLLVCAAMLLAFFGKRDQLATQQLVGGVQVCFVDYWQPSPWIEHLQNHVPPDLQRRVRFRPVDKIPRSPSGRYTYLPGSGAIQVRLPQRTGGPHRVMIWNKGHPAEMAVYEKWFWEETRRFYSGQAAALLGRDKFPRDVYPGGAAADPDGEELWQYTEAQRYFRDRIYAALSESGAGDTVLAVPNLEVSRRQFIGREPTLQDILASGLVLFALFFTCVYLLPSMTCEERERGILLAQALSPASPLEILAAKFLFYPGMGMLLGAVLAGIYRPGVLIALDPVPRLGIHLPFFWLALAASSAAFVGVGLTISSLAKNQRAASLGAMCYLLAVSLLLLICQINMVPFLTNLSVENHTTLMMRSALAGVVNGLNWFGLMCTIVLALFWCGLAVRLFRKYGWQ